MQLAFPNLGSEFLGLYPIVNEYAQLERLLPLGMRIVQLRIKEQRGILLEDQIRRSIQLANRFNTRLFINDYWELAAHYRAYGVHLGQTDLDNAPVANLAKTGLRLGVSAYSDTELVRACTLKPSYIAYGPIFPTTSKLMFAAAQGIDKLRRVRQLVKCPLIAIGGIGLKQLPVVLACKVDGIAVISAISQAIDSVQAARQLMNVIDHV
jgi:hydroxymethylpyrimidine kinase/phosphomethylpyrimidine kinase/thiamine-phosphate diphosphorylase